MSGAIRGKKGEAKMPNTPMETPIMSKKELAHLQAASKARIERALKEAKELRDALEGRGKRKTA